MPSASSVKPEKQASMEAALPESSTSNTNQQNTPIRQAIVIIEHKIRNLDKRKAKLETYRELQRSGKELNQDQKVAVAKYDEVIQTLEFARDLCKQFHGIVATSEKEAKKVARKEAVQRAQQDHAKIRDVLLVQDALTQMGVESIREDFLLGRNGATAIANEDLQLLDDFYPLVFPKHLNESPEGSPDFATQLQQATDHLLAVADAKPKEFGGSTFAHVKEILDVVHSSGYLDRHLTQPEEIVPPGPEVWPTTEEVVPLPEEEFIPASTIAEIQECSITEVERIPDQLPPMPNFPPVPEVVQTVVPVVEHPQPYYPPPPQPRPINEMLETGSFFFLQESELDSPPEMVVSHAQIAPTAPIPSQTFTNQNFSNVQNTVAPLNPYPAPNLPPPIPMPPSHPVVQQAPANSFAEPAPTNFPPAQEFDNFTSPPCDIDIENGSNNRDDIKNGGDWSEQTEDRHSTNQGSRPPPRGGNRNRSGGGNSGYYQSNYYQNNGYSGGGYKPRGGNRSSGGQRAGGQGGNNKGSSGGGQYNRNKPSTQQH